MTPSAALPTVELSRFGWRDIGLWAGAAMLVLGAHVAVAYAVQSFSLIDEADGGPPPAQLIEMAPMVAMPAVEEQMAALDAVTPDQTEPEPAPQKPVEQMQPIVEQADAVPPEETEPAQTDVTEQADQPPLDEVVPDIVETVAPDVVIPLPQAKPVEAPEEKKPVEAKVKKPVEKPGPRPRKEKAPPPTVASADARPAAKTAAPKSAEAASRSGVNPARWNSSLAAWIRRHTRYPSAARARRAEGDVRVTFTIDSSGRVLSARMVGSSGDPDLDRAALAVLHGATVPAPPAELGSRVSRTAPFVFSLRN
ncbi:energy transducer TonB [Mesorhizobium sp. Mes31]|uniref:TonB family protein n=1 Tax=Mesorhizobium sp. Mes31 TaxID=2926017 RepID=UPI002117C483|nr:energy transducer TonB [Mesorhizobium sp. Mes31]